MEGTVGEREARAGLEEEFVEERWRQGGREGEEKGEASVEGGIGRVLMLEEDSAEAEKESCVRWRGRGGCGGGGNGGETAGEGERGEAEHRRRPKSERGNERRWDGDEAGRVFWLDLPRADSSGSGKVQSKV